MTQNEIRSRVQSQMVGLSEEHNNLIINHSTGAGKTLSAIKIIANDLKVNPDNPWLIVVAEITHIKNWYDDIQKHNYQDLLLKIEIICYDSLHKMQGNYNLVLDEVHHLSELRLKRLKPIVFNKIIALSATIPYNKMALTQRLMGGKSKIHIITTSQAIDIGLLPEPVIYVHMIELDDEKLDYCYNFKRGSKPKQRHVVVESFKEGVSYIESPNKCFHIDLHIACTQKQYLELLNIEAEELSINYNSRIASAKTEVEIKKFDYLKFKLLKTGGNRKNFLADCKLPKAREVLTLIEDVRHICFANTIEQCEKLANGKAVVHSKLKNPTEMFEKFNRKEINALYANRMLREGVNLEGIEAGLLLQLDNSATGLIQIQGRVFRSKAPELHLIVVKDSQDEKYFNKALTALNENHLKYV